MFRFGDRRTQMNWVHVHNLVQAHVLAAEALTAAKGYVAVSSPRGPRCPSLGDSWPTHVSPQLRVAGVSSQSVISSLQRPGREVVLIPQ